MIRNLSSRLEKVESALQPARRLVPIWLDSTSSAEPAEKLQEARKAGRLTPGAHVVFIGWRDSQEARHGQIN